MQQIPSNLRSAIRPAVLLPAAIIGILQLTAWVLRDRIIDGQTIVVILTIISVTNIALFIMLKTKFPQFAKITLQSVYMLHILFFLLAFVEWRKL